jgi:DNA-binding NarL/FixJ family response regulator
MTRILVVDDHPIVRRGLKQILCDDSTISWVGEASNTEEAVRQMAENHWDVVVMDITMPGKSGLELLREIKESFPKLPVLVLSIHPEEQYGKRVLKAGASGYLNKESAPEELVQAVRRILRGGKYISPALAERLAGDLEHPSDEPLYERLSDREYDVVSKTVQGKTLKEISFELGLSSKTISTYRMRALRKLGMKNTTELIRYAVQQQQAETLIH